MIIGEIIYLLVKTKILYLERINPMNNPEKTSDQYQINQSMVLTVSSNRMGHGDDQLGEVLIKNFFHTLTGQKLLPKTLILFNSAVLLATEESEALVDLKLLSDLGVEILLCGTCVRHYKLEDCLGIGTMSNMFDITNLMLTSQKLVQL